jgi:Icc-related predicted phosphoesterase
LDGCNTFREWSHEEFVPAVSRYLKSRNLPEKALLVLHNAPSHPNESELKKRKY